MKYVNEEDFSAGFVAETNLAFTEKTLSRDRFDLGCVHFHIDGISAGVVSHEMTHAAMYYWWALEDRPWHTLTKDREAEEQFAFVQGYLVSEFWKNYWRRCDKWAQAGNASFHTS